MNSLEIFLRSIYERLDFLQHSSRHRPLSRPRSPAVLFQGLDRAKIVKTQFHIHLYFTIVNIMNGFPRLESVREVCREENKTFCTRSGSKS